MVEANVLQNWEPYKGIPPLLFGISRVESRNIMRAYELTHMERGHEKGRIRATELVDVYYEAGCRIDFDNSDNLSFIEIFAPSPVKFHGKQIVGTDINEFIQHFVRNESEVIEKMGSVILRQYGLSLGYLSDGRIESAGLFSEEFEIDKIIAL